MARICVLVSVSPWWNHRQFYKQVPGLVAGGHDVIFMSEDPGGDVARGFTYDVIPEPIRRRVRATAALNLFKRVLRHKPDMILLTSIEQLPLGLALKLFTRVKVVFDCRETFWLSIRDHRAHWPKLFRYPFAYLFKLAELMTIKMFDGLITSDPWIDADHSIVRPERRIIFFNCPLVSQFPSNYPPLRARPYDVVLMGSMSVRTGLPTLMEAVGLLKAEGRQIRVLLIGEPEKASMKVVSPRMAELGITDQVTISGKIHYRDIPRTLAQGKIGLVPLNDMPKFRKNIATKTFEYMACGMPCICSDLPPQRLFIREGETGLFVKPGDAGDLARSIRDLLDDIERAEKMGANGRHDIETQWNAEIQQEKLRRMCNVILGDRSSSKGALE